MTQQDLFQNVTYYPVDIRVNRSQSQELKKEKRTLDTSGRTSLELLHKDDPLGLFAKMFMVTSDWGSTKCLLTWKPKATPQGRLLFQLAASTRPTKEIDSGFWATPNTMDHLPQRSEESLIRQANTTRKGRTKPANLREQVDPNVVKMWPTPRASDIEGGIPQGIELKNGSFSRKNQKGERWGVKLKDAVSHSEKMWPTPTTRDHKGGYQGGRVRNGKISNDTLDVAVQYTDNQSKTGGQLNPIFVEWLMGYPIGWTELKD
jgi:hypothetical protein